MDSEHIEQVRLFAWMMKNWRKYPELHLAFAVPNGGHRHKAVATKMKAEGVKPGVPDIFLPVARKSFHGLFIEMKSKRKGASTSQAQDACIEALRGQGYAVVVAHGWEKAAEALMGYLE